MISHKKALFLTLAIILTITIGAGSNLWSNVFLPTLPPAHAATTTSTCPNGGSTAPCLTVSIDPISKPTKGASTALCDTGLATTVYTYGQYGLCDIALSPAAANVTTFRVGAILNASSAATLANVFAWQFQLNYDPTIITPLGDPQLAADSGVVVCSGYPDCGVKTVFYGSQIGSSSTGNNGIDWAQAISIGPSPTPGGGTAAISICENGLSGGVPSPACPGIHNGQILIGFTYVAPSSQIAAIIQRTVLANVAFAIVSKAPAVITISSVKFTDVNALDLGVQAAPVGATCAPATSCQSTTNNIGNNPPIASFTTAHSGTAYSFTDTSTDADVGEVFRYRIWDFGDKTPLLNTTATSVTHDYGLAGARTAPAAFNVTLRDVDSQGDTSAARDRSGNAIISSAPQHAFNFLGIVELGPTSSFTFSPSTGITTTTLVSFNGAGSTYPDEPILAGTAPVGGTNLASTIVGDSSCNLTLGFNCPMGFVDNNANGIFDPGVDTVVRDNSGLGTCTAGSCDVLAGPTPAAGLVGQTVLSDAKIAWFDANADGSVSPGEPMIYATGCPAKCVYQGIKTYTWDFGDGTAVSNLPTPTTTHTFTIASPAAGYVVKLTVTDNLGGTSSITHNVVVTASTRSTTTTISCTPASITTATTSTSTCTATVTDPSATGASVPVGTVTFSQTGITSGTSFTGSPCTLAAVTGSSSTANCTAAFRSSSPGSATISASYTPTDTTHSASSTTTSATVTVTAASHPTTTGVTCNPSTIPISQPTTCTATVTDTSTTGATTPTGTVIFSGAFTTAVFTCTLSGTGASASCIVSAQPLAVGSLMVSANYVGDTIHSASTGSVSVTVTLDPTNTGVSCIPISVVIGQATSCTVTVADTSALPMPPTGTVTLTTGGTCTLAGLTGATACSVSITPTTAGTLTVSASYGGDATHSGSSSPTSAIVTVNKRATTITVSCTPSTIDVGQTTSCTITVTDTDVGTAITPSGNAFLTPTAICTLAGTGATATCSNTESSTSTPGILQVTATYGGDSAHAGPPPSAPFPVTVNGRTTTTGIACPASGTVGTPFTCTVTVTDTDTGTSSTPTGAVTVNTLPCSTLSGTGTTASCTVSITPSATGSLTVAASYAGDTTHAASTGSTTVSISPAAAHPTTTTVTCTPMTLDLGQTTSCTATVTDTSSTPTTPTGALTFLPSAFTCTLQGTATVGVATCSFGVTPPTLGSFTVTPTYPGDSTHATSTGSTSVTVNLRTTSTTVSCPASGTVGTAFSCTVTVTDTDTGTSSTPTGTFTVNGATCTLAGTGTSATCNINITPTATGPLTVTATYPGDTTYATSTGSATVNISQPAAHPTATTVSCSPTTVVVNQATSCTATVTDTSTTGATTPTGTVTFTPSGTCNLSGTGAVATCSVTISFATAGAPKVSATYSGDATHGISTNAIGVTVNLRATSTTIICTPSTVIIGQSSTCTATVADSSPGTSSTPTGTVSWTASIGSFGTTTSCTLTAGSCSVTFSSTTSGSATITGSYNGDTTIHVTSSNTAIVTVGNLHTTTTTISCSPNPLRAGVISTCTTTVTDTSTSGATAPTGQITLGIGVPAGGTVTALCTLSGTGATASCTVPVTLLVAFTSNIQASYPGDTTHSSSRGSTSLTATARPTTTSILCLPASVDTGSATTCTAVVRDTIITPAITPAGTVGFTTSGTGTFATSPCTLQPGAGTTTASCFVTYTPTGTTARTDTITASYVPDAAHAASTNTALVTVTITVVAHQTTTAIVCDQTVVVGQPSLCTATVADTSTTGATSPTGTVTWSLAPGTQGIGTFDFSTCSPTSGPTGVSSCSVHFTSGGPGGDLFNIQASYGGDATHSSSSNILSFGIAGRSSTATITCTTPVIVLTASTCNITITDTSPVPAVTPTGNFQPITSGSGFFGPNCQLAGSGGVATCTVNYTPSAPGMHTITAVLPIGGAFSYNTAGTFDITANASALNPTSTVLHCGASTILFTSVLCTVLVTDTATTGAAAPLGMVTFTPFTPVISCDLIAGTGPVSSCIPPIAGITTIGTLTITASYLGDSSHAPSQGQTTVIVTGDPTQVNILCNPSPVNTGTPTTCTAYVQVKVGITGETAPTGTVEFSVEFATGTTGTFTNSPCTLVPPTSDPFSPSTCSVQYTSTATISRIDYVHANYVPDDATHESSGGSGSVAITALNPTTTTISCTPSPVVIGSTSTCTATVIDVAGSPTVPTGTVSFITDSTTRGFTGSTCNLVGRDSTSATCSVTYSPGGTTARTDRITGTYSGDAQHLTSPGAFNLDVTVGPHPTSVAVSCIPGNPGTTVPIGTTALCHLIINDFSTGATPPTGTVALVSSGTGTIAGSPCSLTALFPGSPATSTCQPDYIGYTPNGTVGTAGRTDTLTFTYSGDAVHSGSSGTFQLSITQNVVPPTVSFTESATTAFRGQSIMLTITTVPDTGTINSITVNWGDTTIDTLLGTATTDSHAYTRLGPFTVTVTVTDSNSLTASKTATKMIINQLPTVSFTETQTTAPTGTPITLTITAADPDGTVASITVNWGDNTPIDTLAGTATTDAHTYAKAGSYTVTVTATDNDGGKTTAPPATKTITDRAPTASFTFTPSNPTVGQTISFDGTTSNDPDGTITTYAWNFGDTTIGTGATTTHAYTAGGSYTVTLTVTDDAGLTGTTSATVQVTQQVTNPGHAKLIQWRADAKFNPDDLRRNPTQILRAFGLNDGNVTVNVYVQFIITNPDRTTSTIYTQVVSLTAGQSINGRLDNRFTASFNALPGRTNVTATIFYSTVSSTIGDSFTPDIASAKTFSFRMLGVRTNDFNFNDEISTTRQSFDASIRNVANIDLASRIDVKIKQPDGTTTSYSSGALLLQSGQDGHIIFIVPLTGPDGNYCFSAIVKFGIDSNHNGQLDNNEILATTGTQRDCFFADTDDAPAGTVIAPPMTITHLSNDDDD